MKKTLNVLIDYVAPVVFGFMCGYNLSFMTFNLKVSLIMICLFPVCNLLCAYILNMLHVLPKMQFSKEFIQNMKDITFKSIMFAGFEDIVFVAPILFFHSLYIMVPLTIISMIFFILAHSGYSLGASLSKGIYIPIAVYIGMNYGLFTIMFSHIVIDTICFGALKLAFVQLDKMGIDLEACLNNGQLMTDMRTKLLDSIKTV